MPLTDPALVDSLAKYSFCVVDLVTGVCMMAPRLSFIALAATLILGSSAGTALAEDGKSSYNFPFQRLSVGGHVGGMGVAGASLGIGFDPYSRVEFEASARLLTGTMETQSEAGFPDLTDCEGGEEVYPCASNAGMFSVGLILGRHNSWEKFNKGLAVRTGISSNGEIYSSAGFHLQGGISEDHTLTWNAEAALGYWFTSPNRAPTDLLALPWDGVYGNSLDTISSQFLLAIRVGVMFYPIR